MHIFAMPECWFSPTLRCRCAEEADDGDHRRAVLQSDPEQEYEEMLLKARAPMRALTAEESPLAPSRIE